MKIALYQGPPIGGDIEAGFTRLDAQTRAAALAGAEMIVFPELFLPGYNRPDLHESLSQPQGGEWCDRAAAIAQAAGCGLTLGWAERDGDTVYNAATAFGPDGAVLGHYRKIQLFGPMENASFSPGASHCIFEFAGIRTALMICYDVEFASHVRDLAVKGVKLLLVPTANPAGFEHVSTAFIPARAAEVGVTVVYANFCGTEQGATYGGHSLICAPDARPLASAGTTETLLIADIDRPVPEFLQTTQLADFRELPA